VIDRPDFRELSDDQLGETEARVHRKLAENFLLCDDTIYVKGGVPLLVAVSGASRRRAIQIVAAGPDRAADTRRLGVAGSPNHHHPIAVRDAVIAGLVWNAGNRQAGMTKPPLQKTLPRIDRLVDEPAVPRERLMVDAIFREVAAILRGRQLTRLADRIEVGLEETGETDTTSRRRSALQAYFEAAAPGWLTPRRLIQSYRFLLHEYPDHLTDEEEDVIGALGT
jgi:hypothetical protein